MTEEQQDNEGTMLQEVTEATDEDVSEAEMHIAAARRLMLHRMPYLSHIVFQMPVVPMKIWPIREGKIAVTERGVLICDAAWAAETPPQKLVGAVMHETLHVLYDHADRRHDKSPSRWNKAADLTINPVVRDADTELPYRGLYPEDFELPEGETAEFYYENMDEPPTICIHGPGGKAECSGDGEDCVHVHCGSGAGQKNSAEDRLSEKFKNAGLDPEMADIIRQKVAEAVKEHQKSRGDTPAGLQRWAEYRLKATPTDLRRELRAVLGRTIAQVAGRVDYSFSKIPRRRVPRVRLPALVGTIPRVVIVLDTSGSVSDAMLGEFAGVTSGMAREAEVWALGCDASASDAVRVRSSQDVKKAFIGGGGTHMGVGIMTAQQKSPDIIIVFTDGETPWVDEAELQGIRTICVVPRGCQHAPPFIPTYEIDVEDQ